MSDLFHNGHRIGFFTRMLSEFHELVEQFVDVGEVPVVGEGDMPATESREHRLRVVDR